MGLDFVSQDDEFCEDYMNYLSEAGPLLGSFEMEEFDKLMPWFERCQRRGIEFEFFKDTAVKSYQLPQMLSELRACYGEIAQRKPFPTPGEPQTDAFLKMVAVLEKAITDGRGLVAICD